MFIGFARVVARDASGPALNHTMINLLVVLLVLVILALLLVAGLLYLRARRRARKQEILPVYDEKRLSNSTASSPRSVKARPSESIYIYEEKQNLIDNSSSPPPSPLPEIRITFPEEVDAAGKRKSGRVVVVRVGDTSVGLEPLDALPAYQQTEGERFQSVDLDRVGGLVEKARNAPNKEYQ